VDATARGVVTRAIPVGLLASLALPVAAIALALAVGGVMLAVQGVPVLEAYAQVVQGAFGSVRGLQSTATGATPLILIGLGVVLAYRANLVTIGAEGQFLVGAVTSVAFVTAPALVAAVPGPILLLAGLVIAAAAGGVWSALSGWLNVQFGASVVITSLLLNYVAQAITVWVARVGAADPDAFTPQTRPVGDAGLPSLPGTSLHLGFALALGVAAVVWVLLKRGRLGLRIDVMGAGADVLDANEVSKRRYTVFVLFLAGAFAGVAGFVEVAGVTERVTGAFSGAVGFTAIMVALLGRLHPVGVVVASLLMAGLGVGFASAGRSLRIPTTTVEIIQALIILFFVLGTALWRPTGRSR
jgi:simple sugar transport system permease protein